MTKDKRLRQFSLIYGTGQLEAAKSLNVLHQPNSDTKIHFRGKVKWNSSFAFAYGCGNILGYYCVLTTEDVTKVTCKNCIKSIKSTVQGMEVRTHPKTGKTICRWTG